MPNAIFTQIGNFIWSCLFLPGLFIAAVILTFGCRGLQFRRFRYAMKQTVGKAFSHSQNKSEGISAFQAASTALGSTVGTGNIVGTAQAICLGGPGALLWLWAAALIAMIVKYAEICLAIHFRKSTPGHGPMDYIEQGLKSRKLALCYGFLAMLSSFAMGNIVQVSSITDSFVSLASEFIPGLTLNHATFRLAVGLILAALTLILISGGAKLITKSAEKLVPFMVVLFICISLSVILINLSALPRVLKTVLIEAFKPGSICAGISGVSTAQCIQWSFRRSAFSNEAGLGTSAIAHASADTFSATEQGLWGIFEVFADTIVICTCTSLCILCSGINIPWGSICGSEVFLASLETVFGSKISATMLALFIGLFAYTSIMGWAMYGNVCTEYVFGCKATVLYRILFVLLLIVGSVLSVDIVWKIADLINALMSLPNLLAVIMLSPLIIRLSRDSFS